MSDHDQAKDDPLVKVARDLREIVLLDLALDAQAEAKAADKDMPGGAAMVNLAPVASPEALGYVLEAAERLALADETGATPWPDHAEDNGDDYEAVLWCLRFWSEDWRREHNAESDRRPTVGSEAEFLARVLQWAYDHQPRWDDFARDVRQSRVRLENVLYAGNRAERTRVTCIDVDCEHKPRLIRVYREQAKDDGYKCPSCKRLYDQPAYIRAKAELLTSEGAARFVPFTLARLSIDRPERTIRKWLSEGEVAHHRDDAGKLHVWWPDVQRMHEETPTRRRSA